MPTKLYITDPEMQVFANTKLTIVSGPLMPYLETIYIASNVWCFLQIFIFPPLFNNHVW